MFILFNKNNPRQEQGMNSNLSVNILRSSIEKDPKKTTNETFVCNSHATHKNTGEMN